MGLSLEGASNRELQYEDGEYAYDYSDEYYEDDNHEMISDDDYMSFLDVSKVCVLHTVYDVSKIYIMMLCTSFIFQILCKFVFRNMTAKHILSFSIGFAALWFNFHTFISHSLTISFISFILLHVLGRRNHFTVIISIALLTYLTLCEYFFEGQEWSHVRSLQMILVMKIISMVADLQDNRLNKIPSFSQYFGYIFCINNCIYGPWINFSEYMDIMKYTTWNTGYFQRILICVVSSLICFILSTCYLDWLLPDNLGWNFLFMYKQAIIFRTSHYFIILMSESFLLASGQSPKSLNTDYLTTPGRIEIPRSLVEVVIYWNVPMHKWLKTYIFKPLREHGRLNAIIGTYFVSSLLHGLNYQLSGVLFSLAVYTFIEHVLREKLARKLDACILAKSCVSDCERHYFTSRFLFVKLINLVFTFIAIYHLTYLGYLIDLENNVKLSFQESFRRWHEQSYSSHVLAFFMAVISIFL